MKTTDILKIFDITTTLPARTLRNDKEILDFVKNCLALQKAFEGDLTEDDDENDI